MVAADSTSGIGSPCAPIRPASTMTSKPASSSRSKASTRSDQTPANSAALPGLVKPGSRSRLGSASSVSGTV